MWRRWRVGPLSFGTVRVSVVEPSSPGSWKRTPTPARSCSHATAQSRRVESALRRLTPTPTPTRPRVGAEGRGHHSFGLSKTLVLRRWRNSRNDGWLRMSALSCRTTKPWADVTKPKTPKTPLLSTPRILITTEFRLIRLRWERNVVGPTMRTQTPSLRLRCQMLDLHCQQR